MTDRLAQAAPLFDLIIKYESEGAVKAQKVASPYDVVYMGISAAHRPVNPLSTYPIGEVIEWQKFVVSKGARSSAAGAFQIIRKTLLELNMPLTRVFDEHCQKECALILFDRRGWDDLLRGEETVLGFADMLAREWASLPVQKRQRGQKRMVERGQSYYAGDGLNKAHASPEEVITAIEKAMTFEPPSQDLAEIVRRLGERVTALENRMESDK